MYYVSYVALLSVVLGIVCYKVLCVIREGALQGSFFAAYAITIIIVIIIIIIMVAIMIITIIIYAVHYVL